MNNKSYIKHSQKKNMENYMDFNGSGVGGYIQSQQKRNMENYMDFNGRRFDASDKTTQKYIGASMLIVAGIILVYIITKKSK